MRVQRQVRGQPRLANTRLPADQSQPQRPLPRLFPQLCEPLALSQAPDIAGRRQLAQPLRQRDPAPRGRLPLELERGHRLGDALQLQVTERTEAMAVARTRELAHQGVDHDLPSRSMSAQPRGLDDRLAEIVVVLHRGLT